MEGLPRRPNWIRYDGFSLLEMEALKQSLAEQYIKADPSQHCLGGAPTIAKAVRANAEGQVDDMADRIMRAADRAVEIDDRELVHRGFGPFLA